MRTELPPLPSESGTADRRPDTASEVALEGVIQDIDLRLKALENALRQMTVNNQTRQVMWNGTVNTVHVAVGSGGAGGGTGGSGGTTRGLYFG